MDKLLQLVIVSYWPHPQQLINIHSYEHCYVYGVVGFALVSQCMDLLSVQMRLDSGVVVDEQCLWVVGIPSLTACNAHNVIACKTFFHVWMFSNT